MTATAERACPLCGSPRAAPIFRKRAGRLLAVRGVHLQVRHAGRQPEPDEDAGGLRGGVPPVPWRRCERCRQLRVAVPLDGRIRDARGKAAPRRRRWQRQARTFSTQPRDGCSRDRAVARALRSIPPRRPGVHMCHARGSACVGAADLRHRHRVRCHRARARSRRVPRRDRETARAWRNVLRVYARRREPDRQGVRPPVALLLLIPSVVSRPANHRASRRAAWTARDRRRGIAAACGRRPT